MAEENASYTLSGTVRHQSLPVAGVRLRLYDSSCRPSFPSILDDTTCLSETTTGRRGEYSFSLKPGSYVVELLPSSSTRFTRMILSNLEIVNNEARDFSLTTGLILSGRIVRADGTQITACSVTALSLEPAGYLSRVDVDQDGRYQMVLPRGSYQLMAGPGQVPSEKSADRSEQPFLGSNLDLVSLAKDQEHDLVIPDLVTFNGQVRDDADNPVPGCRIAISLPVDSGNLLLPAQSAYSTCNSDQHGRFEIQLTAGTYHLSIQPPEFSPLLEWQECGIDLTAHAERTFVLARGFRLHGLALYKDQPVTDCRVKLRGVKPLPDAATSTNMTGEFSVGLYAGTYQVIVSGQVVSGETTVNLHYCQSHTVDRDEDMIVTLNEGLLLSGIVSSHAGVPRPDVWVSVCPDRRRPPDLRDWNETLPFATTNSEGWYWLAVPPGRYWVFINDQIAHAKLVEITTEAVNQDLVWQDGLAVCFEVLSDSGSPVPRCRVIYSLYGQEPLGEALTGDNGLCRLLLDTGIYSFHFEPPSHGSYVAKTIRQLSVNQDLKRQVKLESTVTFQPN